MELNRNIFLESICENCNSHTMPELQSCQSSAVIRMSLADTQPLFFQLPVFISLTPKQNYVMPFHIPKSISGNHEKRQVVILFKINTLSSVCKATTQYSHIDDYLISTVSHVKPQKHAQRTTKERYPNKISFPQQMIPQVIMAQVIPPNALRHCHLDSLMHCLEIR